MPIIETEQQTNQNVISGQEYLDAGATKELVGQLRGYAEGYNDGYDAGVAAGGGGGGSVTAYAWAVQGGGMMIWTDFNIAPLDEISNHSVMLINGVNSFEIGTFDTYVSGTYAKVSDSEFSMTYRDSVTYIREPESDIILWPANT